MASRQYGPKSLSEVPLRPHGFLHAKDWKSKAVSQGNSGWKGLARAKAKAFAEAHLDALLQPFQTETTKE